MSEILQSLTHRPILCGADALRMTLAVGALKEGISKEMLEMGVHDAAMEFALHQNPLQPSDRVRDADALAEACRMVLVELGLIIKARRADPTARKPVAWRSLKRTLGPGALFTGGPRALEAIKGIEDLEAMASRVASHYRDKLSDVSGGATGRPANEALPALFGRLEDLYFELWDDLPALAYSRSQGDWLEAEEVDATPYETGDEFPVRFLKFLTITFELFNDRGLTVPATPAAIEMACRRWRRAQKKLADEGRGSASDWDEANRLAKDFKAS